VGYVIPTTQIKPELNRFGFFLLHTAKRTGAHERARLQSVGPARNERTYVRVQHETAFQETHETSAVAVVQHARRVAATKRAQIERMLHETSTRTLSRFRCMMIKGSATGYLTKRAHEPLVVSGKQIAAASPSSRFTKRAHEPLVVSGGSVLSSCLHSPTRNEHTNP
jgi:hypothetical protein